MKTIEKPPVEKTSKEAVESSRVKRLREQIFASPPKICIERARFVTEAYKASEDKPEIIRRALGLVQTMKKMSIFILDEELIVGNQVSAPRGVPIFPEMAAHWLEEEIPSIGKRPEKFQLAPSDAELLQSDVIPYWKGRCVQDRIYAALTRDQRRAIDSGVFNVGLHLSKGIGHFLLNYQRVLREGSMSIAKDARRRMKSLDPAQNPGDVEKSAFYQAVILVFDAVAEFAERYANLAEEMARKEARQERREELREIARICRWVPAHPARTFREALQSFWFVQLIPHLDSDGTAISPGRFDQYVGPYLDKDLREGRTTLEGAQDLVDQLWLKFNQILSLWKAEDARYFGGFPISQNLIVGGVNSEGQDVTNALSLLCLRATARLHLPQPALSSRLHGKTPEEFLSEIIRVIGTGVGMPALFNDEVVIPALMARGIPLPDAREYAIIGCVEPGWHGKGSCASNAAYFNLLKCLELALGNGVCWLTGRRVGPHTGDPAGFKSMQDLMRAFREQVEWWVRMTVGVFNVIEATHHKQIPFPFNSALIDDCLEKGLDYLSGGAHYNFNGMQGVGVANVADSLAAINTLVFSDNGNGEKKLRLPDLIKVLQRDFDGSESLRKRILSKAPRYGNDDDHADLFAREAGRIFCTAVERYVSPRGAHYHPGLYPVSANVPLGRDVAASADGRRARAPLADGIAPSHGADRKGPTAVLLSAAKLDQVQASNGTQLNQKFLPSVLASEQGRTRFASYLRTFVDLPVMEVQFNVVDAATLRAAQEHPEQHASLVVRVAGYSAFFNDLDRSTQDDIIGRTEQRL